MKFGWCYLFLLLLVSPVYAADRSVTELARETAAARIQEIVPEWRHARLEVNFVGNSFKTYPSVFALRVNLMGNQRPGGKIVIPFEVWDEKGNRSTVAAPAEVKAWKKVVVAKTGIKLKDSLAAVLLKVEEKNVALLPGSFFTDPAELRGSEALAAIPRGTIILASMLRRQSVVQRGETVALVAARGEVSVTARGVALEDGFVGKKIRVRNTDSKKEVEATVRGAGQVEAEVF